MGRVNQICWKDCQEDTDKRKEKKKVLSLQNSDKRNVSNKQIKKIKK